MQWKARVSATALAFVVMASSSAAAQVTSGSVRGVVRDQAGQPVEVAEVTATNQATGAVARTQTTADGRYAFVALPPGEYTIGIRRIGFRAVTRAGVRVRLGETVEIDFSVDAAAAALEALTVTGEAQPLIDRQQSGFVDLVTDQQVEAIPTNGRNFADLVALSPSVQLDVGDGSGGNLSLGGGRRGASVIQIDGAGATGTFFGGEARGSDRIPFAYSIETVREFQVVTNAYDVEYGFFAGGLINAVTKSGTNEWHGSAFGFFRDGALTGDDFFQNPATEFSSRQLGGTLSGPLMRDKLHFYLSVERQDRDEPIFGLPAPGSTPDVSTGVHPDSMARFLNILQTQYGVTDAVGRFTQNQDEWAVFARLDWQLSDRHRLTVRHNYTDLLQENDRISPNETGLNGGIFENTGNSTVLNVTSILGPRVTNDFRAQLAFEPRPRAAFTTIPELEVFIDSDFAGGTQGSIDAECCNDPVLPNNLEETTLELANNLHVRLGDHGLKIGAHFNLFDYENFFFFQQHGRFRFDDLGDFENGIWDSYNRALPNPGPDGQFYTADDIVPLALYKTLEFSVYAQDSWDVTDRLNATFGVRMDFTSFPDAAPVNDALVASTITSVTGGDLRTDVKPSDNNISPRLGLTYALNDEGRTLLRGGAGLFYGRFPSVLYSNSLLNTGLNGGIIQCFYSPTLDARQAVRDFVASGNDPNSIPTACPGGGFAFTPRVNVFSTDFEYPRSLKANAGIAHALSSLFKVELDFVFSRTDNNFYVQERNLLPQQFISGIENRPVFAPVSAWRGSGSLRFARNRVDASFDQALEHVANAEARMYQASLQLERRFDGTYGWQLGYSWAQSKDNSSYSCCISSTALFETATAGDPNNLGDPGDELSGTWGPSEFDRTHTFVLSGLVRLPLDFQVSGIWRLTSGRPWTPVVSDDVNGDGFGGNDRAYIGTDLNFDTPADRDAMQAFIDQHECLAKQVGRIATRNSCRQGWFNRLDLRIRRAFTINGPHRAELIADFFNVLNLINSDWGRNVGVTGFNTELLQVEGFDAATQQFIYSVNRSFGEEDDLTPFRTDQFQVQLGVRYRF